MRNPTPTTILFAALTALILVPVLSFAGPHGPGWQPAPQGFAPHATQHRPHVNPVYHRPYGFTGNSVTLLQTGTCGTSQVRYRSGRLAASGACRQGHKRGTWTAFDRRGRTVARANFHLGLRHGAWRQYDGYGRVSVSRMYRSGHWHQPVATPRRHHAVFVQPTYQHARQQRPIQHAVYNRNLPNRFVPATRRHSVRVGGPGGLHHRFVHDGRPGSHANTRP